MQKWKPVRCTIALAWGKSLSYSYGVDVAKQQFRLIVRLFLKSISRYSTSSDTEVVTKRKESGRKDHQMEEDNNHLKSNLIQ